MFGRSGLVIERGAFADKLIANGISPVFTSHTVKQRSFYEAFGEQLGAMALLGELVANESTVHKFRKRKFKVTLRPSRIAQYRFEIGEQRDDGKFDPEAPKTLLVSPRRITRGKRTIIEFSCSPVVA